MDGWDDDEDFYEDDEPIERLLAIWDKASADGRVFVTARPREGTKPEPCCYTECPCTETKERTRLGRETIPPVQANGPAPGRTLALGQD
jgi:hypothetical protein